MEFQFDPAKAAGNLRKHGVSFADAEAVFTDPLALLRPDPQAEGEQRFVAVAREVPVICWLLSTRSASLKSG
ncbi:MAG TPA: BrnT family toxin [Steroidobacteraceae bacterium]|jgi:hypothetical protein